MIKKSLSTHEHRMCVEVGDLINWREAYYGFGLTGENYHYHVPRYGIVVEIRQITKEDYEFWLGTKATGYPSYKDEHLHPLF